MFGKNWNTLRTIWDALLFVLEPSATVLHREVIFTKPSLAFRTMGLFTFKWNQQECALLASLWLGNEIGNQLVWNEDGNSRPLWGEPWCGLLREAAVYIPDWAITGPNADHVLCAGTSLGTLCPLPQFILPTTTWDGSYIVHRSIWGTWKLDNLHHFPQGHTNSKWQNQGLKPESGQATSSPVRLVTVPHQTAHQFPSRVSHASWPTAVQGTGKHH